MTPRRSLSLVARREFREGLRRRSYRISILIQVLVVVAIIAIASLTSSETEEFDVVAVGARAEAVAKAAQDQQEAFGVELTVTEASSEAGAREEVETGDIDAALTDTELYTSGEPSPQLTSILDAAQRSARGTEVLRREGLDAAQIKAALEPPPLEQVSVGGDTADDQAIAFIGSLLLYLAIIFSGYAVASAVIEEKSSRVIELVLPTVRPMWILAGKLVGTGLLGVIQVGAVAAAGLAAAVAVGEVVDLPSSTAATVALILLYFVLGYALYAAAFAGAASLVSRQEDLQSTTAPPMLVLVAAYIATVQVVNDPDSSLAAFCTLFPPTAPMMAPARAAQDSLPLGELLLSVALMVASIVGLLMVARGIYERGILQTGAPMKIRDALRFGRASG